MVVIYHVTADSTIRCSRKFCKSMYQVLHGKEQQWACLPQTNQRNCTIFVNYHAVFFIQHTQHFMADTVLFLSLILPRKVQSQPKHPWCKKVPYTGNIWRGKTLANLAYSWQFAKFLPSKCLSFTIQIACKSKFAKILPSKS